MKIRFHVLFFAGWVFFLLPGSVLTQHLIPFLGANGQYGYATAKGEVVIQPEFDEAPFFPADSLGVVVIKERHEQFQLRNGMLFPGKNGTARFPLNFSGENKERPDTLRHIWYVTVRGKAFFINPETREQREYWPAQYYTSPNWFPIYYQKNDEAANFEHGFCRVYRGKGKINFINTRLKEVFDTDYEAGAPVSARYILLGNEKQRIGLGNSSGQVLIPCVWESLFPAAKEGFFLANNPSQPVRYARQERAGMIDATGQLVIDTVYRYLTLAGTDFIIAHKEFTAGLLDYAGRWLLPDTFADIQYLYGDYFIVKTRGPQGNKQANVINLKGEKQFDRDYNEIVPHKNLHTPRPYLELWDYPVVTTADPDFQFLFRDTNGQSTLMTYPATDQPYFHTRISVPKKPNGRQGIRDSKGIFRIPPEYDMAGLLTENVDLILVEKDELYGLYNTAGRLILPLRFASIRTDEEDRGKNVEMIWARPDGALMFEAYDLQGNKLPLPPNAIPSRNRDVLAEEIYNRKEQLSQLVRIDGSRVTLQDHYRYLAMDQLRSPDGGFLFDFGKYWEQPTILGAGLNNLLPEGFSVPKSLFDRERLHYTGLLTVYQCSADYIDPEEDHMMDPIAPRLPKGIISSGVINALGNWVIPPKQGHLFLPMSYHWILDAGPTDADSIRPAINALRVHHPEPVTLHAWPLPFHRFDAEHHDNMLFPASKTGERGSFPAYYHADGTQLTDKTVVYGGSFLKRRNLVAMTDAEGQVTDRVLDARGRILFALDPDLEAAVLLEDPDHWDETFILARRRSNGLYGLLDSTGHTLLPFQFHYLNILAAGRLLSANDADGFTQLLDWKGQPFYRFDRNVRLNCIPGQEGYLFCSTGQETLVIRPDNTVLRSLPGRPVEPFQSPGCAQWLKLYDGTLKRSYWADVQSGQLYKE